MGGIEGESGGWLGGGGGIQKERLIRNNDSCIDKHTLFRWLKSLQNAAGLTLSKLTANGRH